MRTFKELDKDARIRVRLYIQQWPTVTTRDLARDLNLRPTTIAALRANFSRARDKKFNTLLAG